MYDEIVKDILNEVFGNEKYRIERNGCSMYIIRTEKHSSYLVNRYLLSMIKSKLYDKGLSVYKEYDKHFNKAGFDYLFFTI